MDIKNAENYYKENFKDDYKLIKDLKNEPLINFNMMLKFAEMYHYELSERSKKNRNFA